MKKVQVVDRCFYCNGQSYIFERERWCLQGDGDEIWDELFRVIYLEDREETEG